MQSRSFPLILVFLIIAIAAVNAFAESYYWYWRMRWFDMPMHFAGGVWLAGTAVWWWYSKKEKLQNHFFSILAVCLTAALGVGLAWERFEAGLGLATVGHINEIADTLGDLFFDTLGGTAVALFTWVRMKQNIITTTNHGKN